MTRRASGWLSLLCRLLMRYRDGVHGFAGLLRVEKKGNWKGFSFSRCGYFFVSLAARMETPTITDNNGDEDFSGCWVEKAIVIWFKFRLCSGLASH